MDFGAIQERLRKLEPAIREHAAEAERLRRLPDGLVERLRSAGAFRLAMPAEWGGPDLTPVQQTELVEQLSRVEASVGWCVMIGMDSGIYARYLDPAVARELFGTMDLATAGWLLPAGVARETDGGYLVDGHWRFGSGCTHADWIVGGCTVYRDDRPVTGADGRPLWRIVMAPAERFTIVDTWRTTGLAGTGSNDYTATGLYVPREHTFSFDTPIHPGPLTRRPDAINRKMPGVALGAARAALDYVYELAEHRRERPSGVRWPESPRIQRAVGECELRLRSARGLVYASLAEQWECFLADREPGAELRASVALARFGAFRAARAIVGELYDLVGGESIYAERTPLDRIYRDVVTACQHIVAQDRAVEFAGQLLLGGEPEYPFI